MDRCGLDYCLHYEWAESIVKQTIIDFGWTYSFINFGMSRSWNKGPTITFMTSMSTDRNTKIWKKGTFSVVFVPMLSGSGEIESCAGSSEPFAVRICTLFTWAGLFKATGRSPISHIPENKQRNNQHSFFSYDIPILPQYPLNWKKKKKKNIYIYIYIYTPGSKKGNIPAWIPFCFWFDFCFTALQHILGHFGRGQLT